MKKPLNQNTAIMLLGAGVATFLVGFGAELATAHSWAEVVSPAMVGKAAVQLGGIAAAIFGALKVRA